MRRSVFEPPAAVEAPECVRAYLAARAAWLRVDFSCLVGFADRFDGPEGRAYVAAYAALCAAVEGAGGAIRVGDVCYRLDRRGGVETDRQFHADNVGFIPPEASAPCD